MINGNGLVIPCPEKVIAIVCMERPMDVKSLQGFLGSVNWFRRHIASHAEIQFPLNQLTDDRVKISEHIKVIQDMKEKKTENPPCIITITENKDIPTLLGGV